MNEMTPYFALVGVLMIALALPMILRRVPPNGFYGLRVPATFKDEQVWYDANAAAGRDLLVLGMLVILFGLVPPLFGWSGESHGYAWSLLVGGGAVLMAVIGWRRANRMLAARAGTPHRE